MAKKANSGSFKKGKPPGPGRGKGTPNKSTRQFREVMQALLAHNEENFENWIKRIAKQNPKAAYDLLLRSAEFVSPKLNRTELAGSPDGNPVLVKQVVDDIPASAAKSADSAALPSSTPGNTPRSKG
jgi:hypothetical protein